MGGNTVLMTSGRSHKKDGEKSETLFLHSSPFLVVMLVATFTRFPDQTKNIQQQNIYNIYLLHVYLRGYTSQTKST